MGNEADNKYTWVIKNFSASNSDIIYSDQLVIGGCIWHLMAFPRTTRFLYVYLVVANANKLPSGWRRHAKLCCTVVNQIPGNATEVKETQEWFDHESWSCFILFMIPLGKLKAKNAGFLVNGEIRIVVEVHVLEVIGILDVSEKSEDARKSVKKIKLNDDRDLLKESQGDLVDLNGFHILPSQVGIVSRIFKKYPDISLEFRAKNQHLRTVYIKVLLSLIETLCQSPQELSNEDLVGADNALDDVKHAGFKVDWLEKMLTEVKEKKEKEQTGVARIQELEEDLKDFKQKCSDIEDRLEKEKAKVLVARAHLTLDEFV